jgi:hypothetical protein
MAALDKDRENRLCSIDGSGQAKSRGVIGVGNIEMGIESTVRSKRDGERVQEKSIE